jgi:hypothetical protein
MLAPLTDESGVTAPIALGHAGVARFRSLLLGLSVKLPVAQSLGADRRAKALTVI